MAETKELIAEIGTGNLGFVLDGWHWWQTGDTAEQILTLQGDEIIAADLNDAPRGVEKRAQLDHQRELPASTGVIDVQTFLNAVHQTGFDGPVRAEPFNAFLRKMDDDDACAATAAALKKSLRVDRLSVCVRLLLLSRLKRDGDDCMLRFGRAAAECCGMAGKRPYTRH